MQETNTIGKFANVVTHELAVHGAGFMSMFDVLHSRSASDFGKYRSAGNYINFINSSKNNILTNGYYSPFVQHAVVGLGLNGYYNSIRNELNFAIKGGGLPNDASHYKGEVDRVKAAFQNINQITQTGIYGSQ